MTGAAMLRRRFDGDRGVASSYLLGVGAAMLLLMVMIADGQATMSGRRQAGDIATEAARAGAQAVDLNDTALGDTPEIDQAEARRIIDGFVGPGLTTNVTFVGGDVVVVTVSVPVDMPFGWVTGDTQIVSSTRSAKLQRHN